jgi:hypothetical protein
MVGTFLLVRAAWKGGRQLAGWVRQKLLTEAQDTDEPVVSSRPARPGAREADDVVVDVVPEPVEEGSDQPRPSNIPEEVSSPTRSSGEGVHTRVRKTSQRAAYERLDAGAGATAADCARVTKPYRTDPVLGPRVEALTDTLESMELRRQTLQAELDAAFAPGTMSWDKFAVPARQATDAILRNACLLSNRIQAFDSAGYTRAFRRMQAAGAALGDGQPSRDAQRLQLFQESLSEMDAMQQTNEDLLLELDRLDREINSLNSSGASREGDQIIAEIERLVKEAAYYR